MPVVYFLPGLMGSTLYRDVAPKNLVWINEARLVTGGFFGMELNVLNGTPDVGAVAMSARDPVYEAYGPPLFELQKQLEKKGITLIRWAYDWRQRPETLGASLAASILNRCDATNPAIIVGHSYGGLVGRFAYRALKAEDKLDHFQRLICLGTPHRGTFAVVKLWSEREPLAKRLAKGIGVSYSRVIQTTATWPSMYCVLPHKTQEDNPNDNGRLMLYSVADNWGTRSNISQNRLDEAKDEFQPLLKTVATIPPGDRMVCLAGKGFPTIDGLRLNPGFTKGNTALIPPIASYLKFSETQNGDGTVLLESAQLPGAYNWYRENSHDSLFKASVSDEWLLDRILEVPSHDIFVGPGGGAEIPDTSRLLKVPAMPLVGGTIPVQPEVTPIKVGNTSAGVVTGEPAPKVYGIVRKAPRSNKSRAIAR